MYIVQYREETECVNEFPSTLLLIISLYHLCRNLVFADQGICHKEAQEEVAEDCASSALSIGG